MEDDGGQRVVVVVADAAAADADAARCCFGLVWLLQGEMRSS
jgi:hypothetical protein